MSTISFECPYCQHVSTAPSSYAGRQGPCPKCKQLLLVPDAPAGGSELEIEPERKVRGPRSATGFKPGDIPCPACAEPIQAIAQDCPHCGEDLTEDVSARRGSADDTMQPVDWVLAFLCPFIGMIVGYVYYKNGEKNRGHMLVKVACIVFVVGNVLSLLLRLSTK